MGKIYNEPWLGNVDTLSHLGADLVLVEMIRTLLIPFCFAMAVGLAGGLILGGSMWIWLVGAWLASAPLILISASVVKPKQQAALEGETTRPPR